jgi:hypothetical protein
MKKLTSGAGAVGDLSARRFRRPLALHVSAAHPDSVNSLLRDLQSGWLRRFDEVK